jgi:hypothetical protein
MISLLTPMRSMVHHVKTSLFLSRNANNTACSSWLVSVLMHTALSGTHGSKGTFLILPSALMASLYSPRASALWGRLDCWCFSSSSHKKCTFL